MPLVYHVHHHRCLPDELSIEAATERAVATWNREPLFHLSSPLEGWAGPKPERHHDYIDPRDFPPAWQGRTLTVEVEAKAKELAVVRLRRSLGAGQSVTHVCLGAGAGASLAQLVSILPGGSFRMLGPSAGRMTETNARDESTPSAKD